jgi:hypothetical protein
MAYPQFRLQTSRTSMMGLISHLGATNASYDNASWSRTCGAITGQGLANDNQSPSKGIQGYGTDSCGSGFLPFGGLFASDYPNNRNHLHLGCCFRGLGLLNHPLSQFCQRDVCVSKLIVCTLEVQTKEAYYVKYDKPDIEAGNHYDLYCARPQMRLGILRINERLNDGWTWLPIYKHY